MDKCLINGKYHYQPKTEREIRNFSSLEINSPVRISLYKKKDLDVEWTVASCYLIKDGLHHQSTKYSNNCVIRNIVCYYH